MTKTKYMKFPISMARSKINSLGYKCIKWSRFSHHGGLEHTPMKPSPRLSIAWASTTDTEPMTFKLTDEWGIDYQEWSIK